jgi:hypothetical protein
MIAATTATRKTASTAGSVRTRQGELGLPAGRGIQRACAGFRVVNVDTADNLQEKDREIADLRSRLEVLEEMVRGMARERADAEP